MKILVCLKQVPDTTTKLNLLPDSSGVDEKGIKWVINPYDEFAIEEALLIKAKKPETVIHVVSLGPKARVVESLRTALAMGADEAHIIDAPGNADSFLTAKALSAFATKQGPFDFLLTGKMAIDGSQGAVSQMLAESLGLAHINIVSKLSLNDTSLLAERDIEGGSKEEIEAPINTVIGANKGLNTPRYASLPGIMKAKKKPVAEYSLSDFGLEESAMKVHVSNFSLPKERPSVKQITGDARAQSQALVKSLREEAKII